MAWLQVQIPVGANEADSVEAALLAAGALSVTLTDAEDQPIFEPGPGETPIWDLVTVVGLFPAGTSGEKILQTLSQRLPNLPPASCLLSRLEDQDWERAWLDDFKPMCFGGSLWVRPTGHVLDTGDGVVMELDPGLAFGTGTHPTTALCLEWLAHNSPHGQTLVDYGCGSGILGIAALLLGADTVYGVDNDPQALQATLDNCRKNALDPARFPRFLPGDFARALAAGDVRQVDAVLANILAGPLVSLAGYLAAMVKPGGALLLSGILRDQAAAVTQAYAEAFEMDPPVAQEDWVRITGKRRP